MNEWSPGGNYSRPGTPNQTSRSFRNQWDESEKGTKTLTANVRAVSENRNRTFQQLSMEDMSKSFLQTNNKNKKGGNGSSDPRFKRVISPGVQNDACVGTEIKNPKPTVVAAEKETSKTKISEWESTELKSDKICADGGELAEKLKPDVIAYSSDPPECESSALGEGYNIDQSKDHLKAVDNLSFSHDIVVNTFSKESFSDCTLNTRNTSLTSEDLVDEFPNDLLVSPSATRVNKVQNWIQDQKPKLEKKQSVITVIGQMQGQDTLSSALREIDKRKQLVKELDKYAVCKKVIETDKEKEISELVAKINFLSKVGRIMFSQNKTDEANDLSFKDGGEKIDKHLELSENSQNEKNLSKDVSAEPTLSTILSRKRSSPKKKLKKTQPACPLKGRVREFFSPVQYQWIFCAVVILSAVLCWVTFFSIQNGTYLSLDLFSQKPKPVTWYEKICMWIWEIFRPSNNYRRMGRWH